MDSPFLTDNIDKIRDLLYYFEDTWIGQPGRRGVRNAAIFPIPLWNVHRQALEELPKTNNNVSASYLEPIIQIFGNLSTALKRSKASMN